MTSCARCAQRSGAGPVAGALRARREFRCPAAARSARGRSICISRGCGSSAPKSTCTNGYIHARAPKGLRGAEIVFPTVTVGGTENVMMAAALAKGETAIVNAAREPEIGDLAECLVAMGARIEGIGTDRLRITGVGRLHGASHASCPIASKPEPYAWRRPRSRDGEVRTDRRAARALSTPSRSVLRQAGVEIEETAEGLCACAARTVLSPASI